jgi:hypothetical protein
LFELVQRILFDENNMAKFPQLFFELIAELIIQRLSSRTSILSIKKSMRPVWAVLQVGRAEKIELLDFFIDDSG